MLAAAIDTMVLASAKQLPVPEPDRGRVHGHTPTRGWLRCMQAMAAVDAGLHKPDADLAADANSHFQGSSKSSILVSGCTIDKLSGSRSKQTVDGLLAMHARRVFPDLLGALAADASLVILLLDAPNLLTTKALGDAFGALSSPAFTARVCIPQADPAHYSEMTTSRSVLCNVTFQRLDTWLDANATGGLHVPIFFADYETSIYGRRSMQLSPLQDLQRFLRYGYASSACLVGVTLSYRAPGQGRDSLQYPADAPVLTHDDLVGFVAHEAACAGFVSELLECFRYGMVFSLFLLRKVQPPGKAAGSQAGAPEVSGGDGPCKAGAVETEPRRRLEAQGLADAPADAGGEDGVGERGRAGTETLRQPQQRVSIRPRQSRLIHGHEHVVRRWRELGFVIAGEGVRHALLHTRELLADPADLTRISVLFVNRSEAEIPCMQELADLARLYPSRVRVAFSLTEPPAVCEPKEGSWAGFVGWGDAATGRAALPSPLPCPEDGAGVGGENKGVMVIVYGRLQGQDKDCERFVEHWAGPMGKKLRAKSKSKMQRVQGALGGVLKEIGFAADQVFKVG